ncbi:hypothetical protein TPHA_0L01170 [Tetrapisispora phaffii CBS 4417]|uniref:Uncharacterized protein n=1 Tax=Tetrapisispora phaffii (strain ATCC 24235 / CBS 4417 / NBRC 1672 / NRRL Y-8282 / UCD 70-5) TaxID=1071381 RepID=G8BZZ6_TETPH|nr:hypothetical protein TPHA_0L01170 [Tetrapisispora phaffii CBS 4417]CCE65474.1 hypothetical protein TPHA_0L01170 [Tetrapisispora phaffii CBS 4417]
MDAYTSIINHEKFSKYTLNITNSPKSIENWETLVTFLLGPTIQLNKNLDKRLYKLITKVYDSFLTQFPYLENYHIDYALLEYKLGHISKFHEIFNNALFIFNHRSLLLWVSYLSKCNESIIDNKTLFALYEKAEAYIGLHYLSGEFWMLYLEQLKERCSTKNRYYIVLRKVLEIPNHSFSAFYDRWFKEIDNIQDLSTLKYFAPTLDLQTRIKVDVNHKGRKGLILLEAKKTFAKIAKDLYNTIQFQVNELYSLFEVNITVPYYCSYDTLIKTEEIENWIKYLNYTIELKNDTLTHLNFQRALIPLANYDQIWLMYANWVTLVQDDYITAKNILLKALSMSNKKTKVLKELYGILLNLNDYDMLDDMLKKVENSFNNLQDCDDFEIFWDYIQFKWFLHNTVGSSRYSGNKGKSIIPAEVMGLIILWLKDSEKKEGQYILLNYILELQNKDNSEVLENKVFRMLIKENISFYLEDCKFWELYCKLILFNPSLSYLNKRKKIFQIWKEIKNYKLKSYDNLLLFCESYLIDDTDTFKKLFDL